MPVRTFLRTWGPLLVLVAFGLGSVELLRRSHVRSQDLLQQTIASLDNISESRRRLISAYLIHDRKAEGDATFAGSSALAEVRGAEYALRNWFHGRSGILNVAGSIPADSALIPAAGMYEAALFRFGQVVERGPRDAVELRASFSSADQAGAALERATHAAVRDAVQAEERAFRKGLLGWSLLLLASVGGAAYALRALRHSELRRVQTESRLARLRVLAPVGIVECSPDGRVLAANPMWANMTRQSEPEWRGREWWEAFEESDRDRARSLWNRGPGMPEATVEARLATRAAGADPTWVLIRIGAGGTEEGAPERRVVSITDVTHQRKMEEQLHHSQRMEAIGRLAGGVAHDFNNLLTSIRGFAGLALEEEGVSERTKEDLVEIERAADRGHALTRQLLTFSRQDRIEPRIVDARVVVGELRRMLDRLVGDAVEIDTILSESSTSVLIDPNQLEQVITNLVVNAADAMEGRGRIRIAIEPVRIDLGLSGAESRIDPGDYVLLAVSDTGPGIPPTVRERIFDPFFTTKEQGKGTGLGLSTVWAIVRQSGGHVHVYSASGQGTVFKVYLPAVTGSAPLQEVRGPVPALVRPPGGTALVVEDEEAVRRLTARVLELGGWTVLKAENGHEALRVMEERGRQVDLIVTDLTMPMLGGVEMIGRLRDRGLHAPTLFVSGFAESEVQLQGMHFLEKPFSPAALTRSVNAVLEAADLSTEAYNTTADE